MLNRWIRVSGWLLAAGVLVAMNPTALADDNAVIKGKVIFKGDKDKYKRTTLDTSKDPKCAKKIGSEQVILNDKTDPITIRNVIVSIKAGLPAGKTWTAPKEPVVLDQNGCQYSPHVVAMMEGQELKVRNSDDTNHNVHFLPAVNDEFNKTQPKQGMEDTVKLKTEAPFKVKCDVHPWMGAVVVVFNHPFFVVTDKEGTFEIKNLPPGKYTVEAYHETFGTQTVEVEVQTGQSVDKDITFEPK